MTDLTASDLKTLADDTPESSADGSVADGIGTDGSVATASRSRRGPFRPARLVSSRQRRARDQAAQWFILTDRAFMSGVFIFVLQFVTPGGILKAPLEAALPLIAATLLLVRLMAGVRLYDFGRRDRYGPHMLRVLLVFAASLGMALGLAMILPERREDLGVVMVWAACAAPALFVLHTLWWLRVERWRREGVLTPNVVVVGATKHAARLIEAALERRDINILGIFDDRLARSPDAVVGVPVLGDTEALLSHKITPFVDKVVVALDPSARTRMNQILDRLRALPNEVALLVDLETETSRATALTRVSDLSLASVHGQTGDQARAFSKRLLDLGVGSLALLLFSPVMLLVALLIKLDSPGPVFFRQRRHGFNNEEIRVWKFRSMRTEMADAKAERQVTKDDDRVTRIGRFIRKTSLDELPQLFNVLKGEMSLVGPRPHAIGMKTGPAESARLVAEYAWRHRIKPGMTGWAAVNGSRGPLHTAEDVRTRIKLDIDYIDRQSIWFDLYIMAITVPCLLGDRDAIR
ncbi:MAG: undecaprenyl-phosphate glucose phosphotransferase [Asticcacaulis sp.]